MQHDPQPLSATGWLRHVALITCALGLPAALCVAGTWWAALLDGTAVLDTAAWAVTAIEGASSARLAAAMLTTVAAVAFLFVVPALTAMLAIMRSPRQRSVAHLWSLAANTAALMLIFLVLRWTCGVHLISFAVAWWLWTTLLTAIAGTSPTAGEDLRRLSMGYGPAMLVGLLAVVVAVVVLFPEQGRQCFCEDGTEAYELARSLRHHGLPHWQLDTWDPIPGGRLGTVVVNPSLVNSYWTAGVQVLLGDNEPATRLSYWVWWLAVFGVCFRLVRSSGGSRLAPVLLTTVPLAVLMWLSALWFTFYVGYNPYMADLANPGVPDALFTLLLLLSFDCLRARRPAAWLVALLMASLVLYAGVVVLVLSLAAAWWFGAVERREAVRCSAMAAGALLAIGGGYVAVGFSEGSLPYWVDTFDIEYVNDYLADTPRWMSARLFLGYFLLGCGGIAAVGLVWAFRGPAWQRTTAVVTLGYLLIVLGSGFKNLHYLGPLLPGVVVLYLTGHKTSQTVARRRCLLATMGLAAAAVVCWPADRQTYTLNRQLGRQTTIATDDYLEAVGWAEIRYMLHSAGPMAFDCDQHTWVAYAQLDGRLSQPRPLVLSDGEPPTAEYHRFAQLRPGGGKRAIQLYTHDMAQCQRLFRAEPLRPTERYPWVFGPLAHGPFSPHGNMLEDVRRLSWPR